MRVRKNEASTFINHQSAHQLWNQFAIINSQLKLIDNSTSKTNCITDFDFSLFQSPASRNHVRCFWKVATGKTDYVATPGFSQDFPAFLWKLAQCNQSWHSANRAGTVHGKQSVFLRIPPRGLVEPEPRHQERRFQASCSRLDRVQSVMPSRVHHGGASAWQKAWVRAPACS